MFQCQQGKKVVKIHVQLEQTANPNLQGRACVHLLVHDVTVSFFLFPFSSKVDAVSLKPVQAHRHSVLPKLNLS